MKRFIITTLSLIMGVLFFIILTSGLSYEKIKYRQQQEFNILKIIEIDESYNVWDLIHATTDSVCKDLTFSKYNNFSKKEANCVGYSQYYSYIFNINAKKYNINAIAKPTCGYVYYCYGLININNILIKLFSNNQNFVKDHDYVEIYYDNKLLTIVDPSFQDLFN